MGAIDDLSKSSRLEQDLKAAIKQKHEESEWFNAFLLKLISSDPSTARRRSSASPNLSPKISPRPPMDVDGLTLLPDAGVGSDERPEPERAAAAVAVDPELQANIAQARTRWTAVCNERVEAESQVQRMLAAREAEEREAETEVRAVQELRRQVRQTESKLRESHVSEAALVGERRKVEELQDELNGLRQRAAALEKARPRDGSARRRFSDTARRSLNHLGSFVGGGGDDAAELEARDRTRSFEIGPEGDRRQCTVM
eukprot:NODE_1995_length_1017_cov_226.613306.p2 GENE.NODE_1995_length_1017_cov_226.613306~~NODE_1995_length_1017_cov_226.613306.p2  ORF type:complete len:257 (+),score=74.10 NODE_1995_length_1017_cov_226.613306:3-773(+)